MELDELHVHQFGAGVIRERMAIAGAFPAVAGDLVGAPGAPGGQHDGRRTEHLEPAALAFVSDDAGGAAARGQEADDRELHVDVDAAVDALILQRANELEAGAVADVG